MKGSLSGTVFCLLWDLVHVRMGEVLGRGGGGEGLRSSVVLAKSPGSKEMHVFVPNQNV